MLQEAALIAEVVDLMSRVLKQVEEQLQHNKAIKQRLEMDWSDKKEAYEIETINAGLQNSSQTLLFKPGATRFPDGYVASCYSALFCTSTLLPLSLMLKESPQYIDAKFYFKKTHTQKPKSLVPKQFQKTLCCLLFIKWISD
jgi:hypothetical protein